MSTKLKLPPVFKFKTFMQNHTGKKRVHDATGERKIDINDVGKILIKEFYL